MSEDKNSRRATGDKARAPGQAGEADAGKTDRDVGHALRSVYSNTVNEEIPSELLDLLGKLD